jgi:hypothetical protein
MNGLLSGFAFALMLGLLGGCGGGGGDDSVAPLPPPPPPPAPSIELTAIVESAEEVSLKWTAPAIYSTQGYAVYANGQAVGWTFAPDTDYLYKGPPATKTCFFVVLGRWEFFLFHASDIKSQEVCVETPRLPPVPPLATGWTIADAELSRAVDIVPSIARAPEGYSHDYLCDSAPGETFSTIRRISSPSAPPRIVNGTECRIVVDLNLRHLHVFTIAGSDLKYQSVFFDWVDQVWRTYIPEMSIATDVDGGLAAAMGYIDPMEHSMHALFNRAGKAVRIRAPYVNPYTGWREEVIGDGLVGPRSLVVASDATVYAALASNVQDGIGELAIHARGADGAWSRIASHPDVLVSATRGAASIVAPAPDDLRVAFARLDRVSGTSRLVYVERSNGVWTETLFDPDANAAPAPSITVNATGETFIAYGASRIDRRLLDYDLRLAARYAYTGGVWELRVIDEAGNVAEKTDTATSISTLGAVVILYSDKDGPSRIAYSP